MEQILNYRIHTTSDRCCLALLSFQGYPGPTVRKYMFVFSAIGTLRQNPRSQRDGGVDRLASRCASDQEFRRKILILTKPADTDCLAVCCHHFRGEVCELIVLRVPSFNRPLSSGINRMRISPGPTISGSIARNDPTFFHSIPTSRI